MRAERLEVACALPVSVDGMPVVATVVMADDKRHGTPARPHRVRGGAAASLAANIAAAPTAAHVPPPTAGGGCCATARDRRRKPPGPDVPPAAR